MIRRGATTTLGQRWSYELPLVEPLSLNDRTGRFVRASDVKNLRHAVKMLTIAERIPRYGNPGSCTRIAVTLIWEPQDLDSAGRKTRPRRDPLNLVATLKAVQDGIVDAGVVPDDTVMYVDSPMPLIDEPRPGSRRGYLTVIIERVL